LKADCTSALQPYEVAGDGMPDYCISSTQLKAYLYHHMQNSTLHASESWVDDFLVRFEMESDSWINEESYHGEHFQASKG
jgi:hypothetical protein